MIFSSCWMEIPQAASYGVVKLAANRNFLIAKVRQRRVHELFGEPNRILHPAGPDVGPLCYRADTRNFALPVRVKHQRKPSGRTSVAVSESARSSAGGTAAQVAGNRSSSVSDTDAAPDPDRLQFALLDKRCYFGNLHFELLCYFLQRGHMPIHCKIIRTRCNAIPTLLQVNSNNYIHPPPEVVASACKIAV